MIKELLYIFIALRVRGEYWWKMVLVSRKDKYDRWRRGKEERARAMRRLIIASTVELGVRHGTRHQECSKV